VAALIRVTIQVCHGVARDSCQELQGITWRSENNQLDVPSLCITPDCHDEPEAAKAGLYSEPFATTAGV